MKKVIVVHGKADDEHDHPEGQWIPWLKKELFKQNIKTIAPIMLQAWILNYEKWKEEFEKIEINKKDILIGHSCGCAFLVRWLGETNTKVKKLILVAPWKIPEEESDKEFYVYDINDCVKDNIEEIIIFTSNNEDPDGKRSAKIFNEALDAEVIELKNHGHYTLGGMGTEEFPELLEKILE